MRRISVTVIALMLLFLSACGNYGLYSDAVNSTYDFFAMDTIIGIKLSSPVIDDVFKECENIVYDIEKSLSKTIADSDVYTLNASEGEYVDMSAASELIALAFDVNTKTDGAFDITLEPVCSLWDVTSEDFTVPGEDEIKEAMSHTGTDKFVVDNTYIKKTDAHAGIDLGGIGKGMAAQELTEHLESKGFSGIVSFGGNIGTVGNKENGESWNIAVKSPFDASEIIGTLKIERGFVAVSGAYERFTEIDNVIYHHIIDPATGRPSNSDLASVAVICENGALADALSTALFVMGSEHSLELYDENVYDFEAVLIKNNGEIILTDALVSGAFTPYNG